MNLNIKNYLLASLLSITALAGQTAYAECVYNVTSDWGSGFNAEIVITNNTGTPASSWDVTWQHTGSTLVTSAWNGTLSGSNPYTVSNASWNGNLAVGQTVTVGLGGSGPGQVVPVTGSICDSGSSSSSSSSSSGSSSGGLPSGISAQDIGPVGFAGSTQFSNGTYTIQAGGGDIEGTADEFHFTHGSLNGDGEIIAKIESVTETDTWTKVGLMFRADLDADAQNAFMLLRPSQGSAFQHRNQKASVTESTWQDVPARNDDWKNGSTYRTRYLKPSKWLRLIKNDNSIEAYSSDDGLCWNIRWKENINFPAGSIYAGVALTSHAGTQSATATVSDLVITNSVPTDVNAQCVRAQTDNDIPEPTQWVITPAVKGGDTWDYTTTNPVPTEMPAPCVYGRDRMRTSADDVECLASVNPHAWTRTGYSHSSGWVQNALGGFGSYTGDAGVNTQVISNNIWMRKEVTLTADEINQVMFWGKWEKATAIYVNGVLATATADTLNNYHYLGMNADARAALVPGVNVISARIYCEGCNAKVDFGMGLNAAFANYPRSSVTTGSAWAREMDSHFQYTVEQAALGGSIAIQKDGVIIENHNFGYSDINLTTQMPPNAVMRLASVDKMITHAAIVHFLNNSSWRADSKVFGPTGVLSHITAIPELIQGNIPGKTKGNLVEDITIEHLRLHISGINDIGSEGQGWKDEVAFHVGVNSAEQLNAEHLARVLYSMDTHWTPGGPLPPYRESGYSSNGYFLLRYIVEHGSGMSFNNYLKTQMSAGDVQVSSERIADRHPTEPGYGIVDKETRARWFELENYLALSASAAGLVSFFDPYWADYTHSINATNGNDVFTPRDGGIGGAMNGTRSGLGAFPSVRFVYGNIWNSDFPGNERRKNNLNERAAANLGEGSCVPTDNLNGHYRLRSAWSQQNNTYLHIEPQNGDNGLKSGNIELYWHSADWRLIEHQEGGQTYYFIQNRWKADHAIHLQRIEEDPVNGKIEASTYSTGWHTAHWVLEDHGSYYKLRNRYFADRYLHIQNGLPEGSSVSASAEGARWHICY